MPEETDSDVNLSPAVILTECSGSRLSSRLPNPNPPRDPNISPTSRHYHPLTSQPFLQRRHLDYTTVTNPRPPPRSLGIIVHNIAPPPDYVPLQPALTDRG